MITRLLDGQYKPNDSWILAGVIFLTLLFQAPCQNISDRLQSSSGFIVMAEKRRELGEHLRRMPMGYFSEGNIGNISTVLATDMTYLEEHGIAIVATIMSDISNIIVMLVFLLVIDRKIGFIYLIVVSLVLLLSKGMVKTSLREAKVRQNQNEALASAVIEFVSGIGVIKSFPAAEFAVDNVRDAFHKSSEDNIHFERKYTPWNILLGSICALGTAGIIAIGFYELKTGTMERGFFLGLALFVLQIFASVKALYGQSANVSLAESSLNRIDALFMETELPDNGTQHIPDHGIPEIEFKNVSFAYGDKEVLHDISFAANKGEMTALAGPSGVGKSTITNHLVPDAEMETGSLNLKTQRGRHTTRHVEIFRHDSGFLYDTPGFTSLDVDGVTESELSSYFPEMRGINADCRFLDCMHINEPDCAVLEAVRDGRISESRYNSYLEILNEIKERKRKYE